MEIKETLENQCVIISVKGRIDSYTAPRFSETLQAIIDRGIYRIILDLREVVYISSAGLRVLIDIHKNCQNTNKGELALVCVPERVHDTLEMVGFTSLFRLFPNVQVALQQVQS